MNPTHSQPPSFSPKLARLSPPPSSKDESFKDEKLYYWPLKHPYFFLVLQLLLKKLIFVKLSYSFFKTFELVLCLVCM